MYVDTKAKLGDLDGMGVAISRVKGEIRGSFYCSRQPTLEIEVGSKLQFDGYLREMYPESITRDKIRKIATEVEVIEVKSQVAHHVGKGERVLVTNFIFKGEV